MKIRFLDIAEIELDEAVEYYNHESPGLGDEFLAEIIHALDRIARFPEAWPPCSKRTRRYLTRRFPYGVIYRQQTDEILVVAIANLHRKPGVLARQADVIRKFGRYLPRPPPRRCRWMVGMSG